MKKVLIVDDDRDILTVVKYLLKSHGFKVHTHSTGLNVPEVVDNFNPDLILLDIMLPGKTGIEICKELKLTSAVPIVLFSAHADKIASLAECKADAFVEKPFEITQLLDVINLHLN